MTRVAAALVLSLLTAAGAAGRNDRSEPLLAAIVATSVASTSAVLPDVTWQVELPWLEPGDTDAAVSPDGRRIAFVSARDGNPEVYVADARTRKVRRLTRSRRAEDRGPAWSPEGRDLVWQSGPPGASDLFVMRADGSGKRRLVGGLGEDVDPAWSPDGTRIAFSSNRSGRRELWTVAAAGGEPELLATCPGRARSPAWAPGGMRLVFACETARASNLWVVGLADGRTERLTQGGGRDSHPDWSPAGAHIAFSRLTARRELWLVDVDGGRARPVPGTDGWARPDWARTARLLVARPDERLPDLDQRAPSGLVVTQAGRRFRLGFVSSTENRGLGPLVLRGVRTGGPELTTHQLVERRGGGAHVVREVGRMRYEHHDPHHHWHVESFVSYELREARSFAVVARHRKSGFCLIDRSGQVSPRIPGTGPPRFVGDCGAGQPDARAVEQGTSVGYVDRYPAFFHGQDLDVTALPAGRYVLVQRANPSRTMRELRYANNAASVLLRLTWPNGPSSAPRALVLRRCEATERCPPP